MATTIYTYLHNDDLNGSRIVSMDDCMCKLYNIKRDDAAFLKDFNDDLQKPALYILLNKKQQKAYIGETDDFTKRIVQHLSKKIFGKKFWSLMELMTIQLARQKFNILSFVLTPKLVMLNHMIYQKIRSLLKDHTWESYNLEKLTSFSSMYNS